MFHPDMARAQIAQLERSVQALALEKEQYARLTVLLSNLVTEKGDAKMVDGCVAIDRAAFEDVPKRWQVGLKVAKVRPEGAPEDGPTEEVVIVSVVPRPEANGLAHPKPRLVLPN